MKHRFAAIALGVALTTAPTAGQEPAVPNSTSASTSALSEEIESAAGALVPELEQLIEWCNEKRLRRERDRLWRHVLELDPEHKKARRALRYHRIGSKGWRQSKSYREPRNQDERHLQEFEKRFQRTVEAYRIGLLDILDRDDVDRKARDRVIASLLAFDPDDATVRASLGETLVSGRWVLDETAETLERREFIPFLAKSSLDVAPEPEVIQPNAEERALPLEWQAGRRTPKVRVLGTTGDSEVFQTARTSHAVGDYFRTVFRERGEHRPNFHIYMLLSPTERDQLLGALKGIDGRTRSLLRSADGGWLGRGDRLGEWSLDQQRRLDGAVRQTLGTMMMDSFGIDGRHGWAWEGMGLYLTYHLIGTRKTFFIQDLGYGPKSAASLWWRLQVPGSDWMEEGRQLLLGPKPPRLQFLLGKEVNVMSDRDMLFAYVLAAYLLEGRSKTTPEILRRIGGGEHPVEAFESVFNAPIADIETRLRRWLEETRGA